MQAQHISNNSEELPAQSRCFIGFAGEEHLENIDGHGDDLALIDLVEVVEELFVIGYVLQDLKTVNAEFNVLDLRQLLEGVLSNLADHHVLQNQCVECLGEFQ